MRNLGRILAVALAAAALPAAEAAVVCRASGSPVPVRSEGLTELAGAIALGCTGSPGERVDANLTIFLTANVTNRLADGGAVDASVTVDGTPVAGVTPLAVGANAVAFNGISVQTPESGSFSLVVSGIRIAVAARGIENASPIDAFISVGGPSAPALQNSTVTVGIPRRGLLSSGNAGTVNCYGSPVPSEISVSRLFGAGTRVYSTRVSEGYPNAFEKASAGATGTRILLRWTGLPAGTRVFLPDVVAGANALQPTSGGDLYLTASGGAYRPSAQGSLMLARVLDADAQGAGGTPAWTPDPSAGDVSFDAAHEVTLTNGAGSAAFEVVESNPTAEENAHIPTFFGLPANTPIATATGKQFVSFGPLSTVDQASPTAPVLRFADAIPPLDCIAKGDCGSFPKLAVEPWKPFTFTAASGGKKQSQYASVKNAGTGILAWSLNIVYKNGADWITVYAEPNRGSIPGWFRMDVDPSRLAPGTYEAEIVVDAGPTAGSDAVPVRLTVTPGTTPAMGAIVNAASFMGGALTPGSIATIFGERLSGKAVQVSFDGIPAQVFYSDAAQINILVPAELGSRPSAQLLITVDGLGSAPRTVTLGTMNPAVFANGVLNQDNSVNAASKPAAANTVLQIFATGLPAAENGSVLAMLNGTEITSLDYAGPAPGLAGLWQINARVPQGIAAGPANLSVCGVSLTSTARTCSPAVKVYIQ